MGQIQLPRNFGHNLNHFYFQQLTGKRLERHAILVRGSGSASEISTIKTPDETPLSSGFFIEGEAQTLCLPLPKSLRTKRTLKNPPARRPKKAALLPA
jgi:hypothetical protein